MWNEDGGKEPMKLSTKYFIAATIYFILGIIMLIVMLICWPNLPIAFRILDITIIAMDMVEGLGNLSRGSIYKEKER